jgi:hypothetical protein
VYYSFCLKKSKTVFLGSLAREADPGSGRLYAALDYLVEKRWLRVGERQSGVPPNYTVDDRVWTLYGDRAATLQGRWAK